MRFLTAASLLAGLAGLAAAQTPNTTCSGSPNTNAIIPQQPVLVQKVTNGAKFYSTGIQPPVIVLHVTGHTFYEMGYAYGQLMQKEMQTLFPQVMDYMNNMINSSLPAWVPEAYRQALVDYGVDFALDLTYNATRPYTPDHHYEVMQGMADGSGIPVQNVTRLSLIPEMIKASCSMMGAYGPATANNAANPGKLVQLRALDWDTDGPFQQFPVLVTWHQPNGSANYTSLGYAGMLGTITGMSSSGMGISEKLWAAYSGVENIFGYVWTFLLQDILAFDMDTDQALSRIATANRTCSFWIGLGDSGNNQFKIVGYSNQLVNIYNDRNFPAYPPYHDQYNGLLFLNKHVQPSYEPCMNQLAQAFYGSISPANLIQYVVAMEQTGDMHIAVMDFGAQAMYVSNAAPVDPATGQPGALAYQRPFLQFDMQALWALDPNQV